MSGTTCGTQGERGEGRWGRRDSARPAASGAIESERGRRGEHGGEEISFAGLRPLPCGAWQLRHQRRQAAAPAAPTTPCFAAWRAAACFEPAGHGVRRAAGGKSDSRWPLCREASRGLVYGPDKLYNKCEAGEPKI